MSKTCNRCGECCHRGDFWQYSEHPKVKALLPHVKRREDGRCAMLIGENICLIEALLGRKAKPDICKKYVCEKKAAKNNPQSLSYLQEYPITVKPIWR